MRALTPRVVACWADPVLVGPHAELDVRAFAACVGLAGSAAGDVTATLLLRNHDSGTEHRLPGRPLRDPGSRPRPLKGRPRVVGTHVVTRLDDTGTGLGEGRWGALLEVVAGGDRWERRLTADRVDPLVDRTGALLPLGHPRYPVRLTARGSILVDVHADPEHVEVGDVWVHEDCVEVHGRVVADDVQQRLLPGPTRAVASGRGDGRERPLAAQVDEDGRVTVLVRQRDLLGDDAPPVEDETWDLLLEAGDRRLRLAGLHDDIAHKSTVHSYPPLRTASGSVEVRYDPRNLLVVHTGRPS